MLALDRVVRIGSRGKPQLGRNASAPAATARIHGCDWLGIICEHQVARGRYGSRCSTLGRGRFAQKLAVGRVAEIELMVPSRAGDVVGTSGNRLCLQSLEWRVRRIF